jgi:protein-tyrosine phosphatase
VNTESTVPVPDRSTASPEELLDFARRVGIAEVDLPRRMPEPWRLLRMSGGYNFRDAGGYEGLDGRAVKRGLVWRSDHMNELTDDDLALVDTLGLQVIHDFRLDLEVARQPSRLPANAPQVKRLVFGDVSGAETSIQLIGDVMAGRAPMPGPDFWDTNYLEMLENGRSLFVGLFESMADPASLPSLYHCTGGKDRTGIATVLLLGILGVDHETVINDFLFTNLFRTPFRVVALTPSLVANGVDPVGIIPVLGVCRSAIEKAIAAIDATYGGPERYLIDAGLSTDAPARLRDLLLE